MAVAIDVLDGYLLAVILYPCHCLTLVILRASIALQQAFLRVWGVRAFEAVEVGTETKIQRMPGGHGHLDIPCVLHRGPGSQELNVRTRDPELAAEQVVSIEEIFDAVGGANAGALGLQLHGLLTIKDVHVMAKALKNNAVHQSGERTTDLVVISSLMSTRISRGMSDVKGYEQHLRSRR